MENLTKKQLLWGGGALVGVLVIYLLFRKKKGSIPPDRDCGWWNPNCIEFGPVDDNGGIPPFNGDITPIDDNGQPTTTYASPASVTTKSGTRLREKPSTDSKILKTYKLGEVLDIDDEVTQADGSWYHVKQGGWVRHDVVTTGEKWVNPGFYGNEQ
jgi:hypothetical protein